MLDKLGKLLSTHDKNSGKTDVILTLVVLAVMSAVIKFLLDGVTIDIFGHIINFGHTDSVSYGTMLSPILGAHGYMSGRGSNISTLSRVDNPDEGEEDNT